MTTYYVSPDGSDANNGLGPDASHATNKPWLTVGKAINTGATPTSGDVVWIAPGNYFSNVLVPIAGVAGVSYNGDPFNTQGFKTSGGVLRPPGFVYVGRRTSGELDAVATGGTLLEFATNSPAGLAFRNLILEAGAGSRCFNLPFTGTTGLIVEDCIIVGGGGGSDVAVVDIAAGVGVTLGHRFRRNTFIGGRYHFQIACGTSMSAADLDMDIIVEDGMHICGGSASSQNGVMATSGTNTNKPGGFIVRGLTVVGGQLMNVGAGHAGSGRPSRYSGCLVIGAPNFVSANASGQVVDDGYNRGIAHRAANTNCTEAATTKRSIPPFIMLPHFRKWGYLPSLPAFAWLLEAHTDQKFSGWSDTDVDFFNGRVRPWGGGPSIGAIEVPNLTQDTSSKFTGGGVNSLKLVGAGEAEFFVAVNPVPTTISVNTESDGGYSGGSWPRLIVKAEPDLGIPSDLTDTATDATEQPLETPSFTPTKAGVVRVVLESRSATVTSSTWFDDLTRND